ncbi:MAG: enoyl-CoA hydratase/isomerase family protein [Myxococcales bacterium]|nr:enoyl-CoA hydratase/isomerase family protein [Myxococcales bacterium]
MHREIVLSGPGKNAMSTELMERTRHELEDAQGAPVLLTGEGSAFSAGLDLREVIAADEDHLVDMLSALDALIYALYTYPGPTVALVNGHAIAGGCVLALACDHRVVADDPALKVGLNETANGLVFPPRVLALVRARVPRHAVARVVLEGGLYAPDEARALGLVDEVSKAPRATARARLEALARHPSEVYARNKLGLQNGSLAVEPDDDRRFREEGVPMWASDETKARLSSLLRPRP